MVGENIGSDILGIRCFMGITQERREVGNQGIDLARRRAGLQAMVLVAHRQ